MVRSPTHPSKRINKEIEGLNSESTSDQLLQDAKRLSFSYNLQYKTEPPVLGHIETEARKPQPDSEQRRCRITIDEILNRPIVRILFQKEEQERHPGASMIGIILRSWASIA